MATLESMIANDMDFFDTLETVTFTNPDASTRTTTKALKMIRSQSSVTQNEMDLQIIKARWHVPISDMSTFVPHRDGFLTDAGGNKWYIDSVEKATRSTRFAIDATLESGKALR